MSYYLGYHFRRWAKDNHIPQEEYVVLRDIITEVQGVLDRRCEDYEKSYITRLLNIVLSDYENHRYLDENIINILESSSEDEVIPAGATIHAG